MLDAGHPTPGPFRFWRVTRDATRRAACDAFELSVGNETETLGLLTAWPAATFAERDYGRGMRNNKDR